MKNTVSDIFKYTKNPAKRAVFLLSSILIPPPSRGKTHDKNFDGAELGKVLSDVFYEKAVAHYKKTTKKTIDTYRETLTSLLQRAHHTAIQLQKKEE